MFVGISAVGVFRTEDDGADLAHRQPGTRAEFLPEKYPEFGQCVHKLLMANGESAGALPAKPLRRLSQRRRREKLEGNLRRAAVRFRFSPGHSSARARHDLRASAQRARNSAVRPKTSCASSAAATPAKPGSRWPTACRRKTSLPEFTAKAWRWTQRTPPEFISARTPEKFSLPPTKATPGTSWPTICRRFIPSPQG